MIKPKSSTEVTLLLISALNELDKAKAAWNEANSMFNYFFRPKEYFAAKDRYKAARIKLDTMNATAKDFYATHLPYYTKEGQKWIIAK